MSCSQAKLRCLLLVVLLALLPLRGWAAGAMAASMSLPAAGMVQQVLPPCHGAAPVEAETAAEASDEAAGAAHESSHHGCSSCLLCHSGIAPAPSLPAARALESSQAPHPGAMHDTGRLLPAVLERPPRG